GRRGAVGGGEVLVQEVVREVSRSVGTRPEPASVRSWIFSIAHNRCIDFLRKQRARGRAESRFAGDEDSVLPVEPAGRGVRRAVEQLVINLPPKERACVLLHDVFGYSHREIAALVDSTAGASKVA